MATQAITTRRDTWHVQAALWELASFLLVPLSQAPSASRLTTVPSLAAQTCPLTWHYTFEVLPEGSGLGTIGLIGCGAGLASGSLLVSVAGETGAGIASATRLTVPSVLEHILPLAVQ